MAEPSELPRGRPVVCRVRGREPFKETSISPSRYSRDQRGAPPCGTGAVGRVAVIGRSNTRATGTLWRAAMPE